MIMGVALAKLTPRQIDILWGIAKGFSYAEIASHLKPPQMKCLRKN